MKKATAIIFRSLLLLLTGIAIGLILSNDNLAGRRFGNPFGGNEDKISKILQLVRNNYVDTVDINHIEGEAINNVLQNLDPHSLYLPPQQAASINERLDGGFDGIGIEYKLLRDTVYVTKVYPSGPAAKAGIITGQRVVTVNGQAFSGTHLTPRRIHRIFRGPKNSTIILGLSSISGPTQITSCKITRARISLSSVDAAYMAARDVGYIKLDKFASTTDADFRLALQKLKTNGLQKLILDLRGNGGGYLNAATALADEFLTKGKLIVYTQGEHEPRTDYFATDSGRFQQGNLAVLIDEYSASASEILAGCLQDLDRATLIGRRSFGKGLVQEQFPFADGSAINLTVARYYTPSGRSIQKSYKKGLENYHHEIADRLQKGELFSAANTLKDSAFKTASVFHTLKGKKVYSGGGIMPDVFIPADTTLNTPLIDRLNDGELFTAYVIDELHSLLKNYRTEDDFINQYNISDKDFDAFIAYVAPALKEMDARDIQLSKDNIKKLLKAYMGRFGWGDNAYYRILNNDDPAVKKAVEVVE
jgi:carboxyl-terminal processing protease